MIDADNIGKRIRLLRRKKRVSQERMAEDLGMYQADISNLERAMGGSGITDLFKLDMIADYFGVPLAELLNGSPEEEAVPAPAEKAPEGTGTRALRIGEARFGEAGGYPLSEAVLTAPDGRTICTAFLIRDDQPRFYRSGESMFDALMTGLEDPDCERALKKRCFLSGKDFVDIFRDADPEWVDVIRYLIFIATEGEEDARRLIGDTVGKTLGEIDVPVPFLEPADLYRVNYADLGVVYRCRLMVEAGLKNPGVFSDMDNTWKREKAILEKLKAACVSEEAYRVWKKDLVDAKMKEVIEKQHIVVCTYMFIGMGRYKEILPEEMVPSFKCWIDGNGSALFLGSRDATKREIRTYVSRHIADDLLGI